MKGKVYLVGAGPGDPGLITVRGVERLKQADVVVYDRLIDERLLDYAPADAERIYVGKAPDRHAMSQEEINRLLVELAGEGKTVVRLKGGDPFVLGRGGEEAETLVDAGIPFQVVPGVTSAVAVPAYAGIPVTHRGLSSSLAVVTGHEDPAKNGSNIAWDKLATGVDTLIFLMGVRNLPQIVARLVEHGRAPNTPAAVIKDGAGPAQRTVVGTLETIVEMVQRQRITSPAITVVGEVVRMREKLRWFDAFPLFGKRVLVTRSRHQASELSRLLSERGARPVELPAIDVQPVPDTVELDRAIADLNKFDWLLLTSVNGVDAFFGRLYALGLDGRAMGGLKIGAIGPATAGAIRARGIRPDYVPEDYTSEGIIAGLKGQDMSGRRFLLARADIAPGDLIDGLTALGAEVREVTAYRTVPAAGAIARAGEMLASGQIDVVTFTSSSTVSNAVAALGAGALRNGARIACIGPKTAETAVAAGLKVDVVAGEHTIPGLVVALERYFQGEGHG
ncbi:MAG: uroporphyrinogen-III C-methyltransferase [Chloroflexi bacterium]|nr:uroporphyrinogen-III C-methyltransferase [Chloroflexota bacterium]